MKIGYARVSTIDQNLDLQIDSLKKAGCQKIITDKISGSLQNRIGLEELLNTIRKNDEVIVWRLDRLGRSLKHLIELITIFNNKEVFFTSITESINTKSSSGKLIFHIFASLSEFERNLISERTKSGLQSARARGKLGGRPKKAPKEKRQLAKDLYDSKKYSLAKICNIIGISKPTLYKYIRE
ncbi:recombinase family protein [Rickettsiales bacterium]|nr:recombinase family protein [Rickettsiales bacterium]